MKKLLVALALAGSSLTVHAENTSVIINGIHFALSSFLSDRMTVVATGVGVTQEQAISAALHSAVQKVVGVLIISDRVVNQDTLVRNIVAQYSSGVVDTYEILNCSGRPVVCDIEAKVSPIKFMRKLEGDSDSIQFSGSEYYEKHLMIKNAIKQRSKILEYYMKEMHRSGLDVRLRSVSVVPSLSDNATLDIKYHVRWNSEFRSELLRVLHRMENDVAREEGKYYYIQYGATGIADNRVYVPTHSPQMYDMIKYFVQRPMRVYFRELDTCATVPVNGIFKIEGRGETVNQRITVAPDKLKEVKSITIRVGC